MNEATITITGAVRAATDPSTPIPHHPSQFVPRPALYLVDTTPDVDVEDDQVWADLERMLKAREVARAFHPAGKGQRIQPSWSQQTA